MLGENLTIIEENGNSFYCTQLIFSGKINLKCQIFFYLDVIQAIFSLLQERGAS